MMTALAITRTLEREWEQCLLQPLLLQPCWVLECWSLGVLELSSPCDLCSGSGDGISISSDIADCGAFNIWTWSEQWEYLYRLFVSQQQVAKVVHTCLLCLTTPGSGLGYALSSWIVTWKGSQHEVWVSVRSLGLWGVFQGQWRVT